MDIEIKRNSLYDDKADDLKWDLHAKYAYRSFFFSFLLGLGFIAIYSFNNSFNTLQFIGSILIVFSITSIVNTFRDRSTFKHRHDRVKKAILKIDNEVIITIQNTLFKYKDFEINQELRWSVFSSYKYTDDILFLLRGGSYLSSYAIYKSELTEEEFLELLAFVRKIFPEKK